MSTPLVSVIIPTYNRSAEVCAAIDNVLAQTYLNTEIIIVDDGSTDDTQERLRKYGDRIRIVTQANAGPAVARNRGIELARGEIIAFQDSDDLWKPTKLERQVALLARYDKSVPCCLCNAAMGIIDGKERTTFDDSLIHPRHAEGLWLNVPEVLATRFVLFNQTVAIRREVLERIGGFPEDLKYLEDYDLPLRLALEGPWAFIREPLVIYQEGAPESFSKKASKDPVVLKECQVKIFERMLTRIAGDDLRADFRRQLKRRLRMIRGQLVAVKLCRTDSFARKAIGRFLLEADHYLFALFRRSPWFPQPITIASDTPNPCHAQLR